MVQVTFAGCLKRATFWFEENMIDPSELFVAVLLVKSCEMVLFLCGRQHPANMWAGNCARWLVGDLCAACAGSRPSAGVLCARSYVGAPTVLRTALGCGPMCSIALLCKWAGGGPSLPAP